jgi:predicted nucleic acid-binding protein
VTYLLDTNVLSETRKRQPEAAVVDWIAATPADRLHVSVLTLGEIAQGIASIRGRGDGQQASTMERWLRDVEVGFEDRILPVTLPVAVAWGRQQYAQPLPVIAALIAATARVHDMTVVTRNVKDFELAGVQVLNPFTRPADAPRSW